MTGFAIHANEPLFVPQAQEAAGTKMPVRDAEWFKAELLSRGVKGFEIICGDYKENFFQIPPQYLEKYLALRPLKLHRTALETVLAQAKENTNT